MNRNVFIALAALAVFCGCGGRAGLNAPKTAADDPYVRLAAELTAGGRELVSGKVAVLPFACSGQRFPGEGQAVADNLGAAMAARGGMQVMAQGLVRQALSGAGLEPSAALSPAAIKDIGGRLGAAAIVTGTLIPRSDGGMVIKARLIATSTVSILIAAEGVLPPAGSGGRGAGVLLK